MAEDYGDVHAILQRLERFLYGPTTTTPSAPTAPPSTTLVEKITQEVNKQLPSSSSIPLKAQRGWVYDRVISSKAVVPGQALTLFTLDGPGYIHLIQIAFDSNTVDLILKIDGSEQLVSIDEIAQYSGAKVVPLSDEFYFSYITTSLNNIGIVFNTDIGFPFKSKATFAIKNTGSSNLNIVRYRYKAWLV